MDVSLLDKYGIPFANHLIIKNRKDLIPGFEKLGCRVALKIMSKDILHKSDAGCVVAGISDRKALVEAYDSILANAEKKRADISGVMMQEMLDGKEIIIGVKRDEQFGHVIAFGIGGIFVEVLQDVSLRVLPVTKKDCLEMMDEIKASKIITGYRGQKGLNKDALASIMLKLNKLIQKNPGINEMDLNPVICDNKRAIVVDVRIL